MEILRAVAPTWFIIAGVVSAVILGLNSLQMVAAIMFGGFLCELTYAIFFDQTLSLLMNKPSPHMRYFLLTFAAIMLLVSWILWSTAP